MLQVSRLADEIIYINNGKISNTIHENIYNGRIVGGDKGKYVEVQEKIRFPVRTPENGSTRISIDPLKIKVKKDIDKNNPSDYQFKGRIIQLTHEGDRIRINVDINIPLILLLEKEKYSISGIGIGDTVIVECLEEGIKILFIGFYAINNIGF